MSVSLHPSNALSFKRPLTQVVKRNLAITNHNAQPVAFKVKTTAPKLYCVRPNSGRVEPGESVEVSVMLQALPEEPPLNAKCKDKFLIQSTLITAEKETMPLQSIWQSPETNEEGKVHQQKLRVTYLPADGQPLEEEDEEMKPSNSMTDRFATVPRHNGHHPEVPATGASGTESSLLHESHEITRPFTPAGEMSRENSNEDSAPEGPLIEYKNAPQHPIATPPLPHAPELAPEPAPEPAPLAVPVPVREPEPAHEPIYLPPPPPEPLISAPIPAPVPVPVPAPKVIIEPDPTLLLQLEIARAEIERLRARLATMSEAPPTELRRRRSVSDVGSVAETEVATVIDDSHYRHHQDGVPLQVVVIIALGVFITTYLFF